MCVSKNARKSLRNLFETSNWISIEFIRNAKAFDVNRRSRKCAEIYRINSSLKEWASCDLLEREVLYIRWRSIRRFGELSAITISTPLSTSAPRLITTRPIQRLYCSCGIKGRGGRGGRGRYVRSKASGCAIYDRDVPVCNGCLSRSRAAYWTRKRPFVGSHGE